MKSMETLEIVITVQRHKRRSKGNALKGLRRWAARLNGWTVAWYALLTVAGVLLYRAAAAYALEQRGYYAVGGEVLCLLLPVLYYTFATTIRDWVRYLKNGR